MNPVLTIARARNLKVIEDAAQSIGAQYHGKKTGSLGHAGCFSFHPLKTLNACGDAGVITTDDKALADRLRQLRNIGLKDRDKSEMWGFNSRLDTIQAAILNLKMDYFEEWTEARRRNARFYQERLKGIVGLPKEESNTRHVYHTFVIQTDRRDALQEYLQSCGIGSKVHYPIPIHLQSCAKDLGYKRGGFPICEQAASRILSLPIYHGLVPNELATIADAIGRFASLGG